MESAAISKEQADSSEVAAYCVHCNAPVSSGESFCCIGCKSAYGIMHSVNNVLSKHPVYSVFAVKDDDEHYSITLSVQGIHCASCINLIERSLYSQADVTYARVNMSTERLVIKWNGKAERADAFAQIIRSLGYKIEAFDISNKISDSKEGEKFLLRCIAVAGFASGNLMMISVGLWSSTTETMGLSTRDFLHLISAMIALPAVVYSCRPFFYSAFSALKEYHTNMDVPISLGIILASAMSVVESITHGEHVYFDSAVMLSFFLLIGRYLETKAKGKARESAKELLSRLSGTATVLEGDKRIIMQVRDLREDMTVIVASGENIPVDGLVIKGNSDIDMSIITGETIPCHVAEGENVFAGTTNLSMPIIIKVTKASENSLLSDIVKLMENAQQGQARYVRLADKAAKLYTPVVHTMAALTFILWWQFMGHGWQESLLNAITVLVITCPCALGLAVPVVQVLASSVLMRRGVLPKSGDAIEKLASINVAVFDKTGTLTLGRPELVESGDNLRLAASIASYSSHPLAKAICHAYDGDLIELSDIKEFPGKGLEAFLNGKKIQLGSRIWCGDKLSKQHSLMELWLAEDNQKPVCFIFDDKLRDDAKETIENFQKSGIKVVLLSGDRIQTVEKIAGELGISEYKALLSPVEKCEYIENLKEQGLKILMVGDGLNDAPSLAAANVSISPSSAIDISQNTADIVFQGDKLMPVFNTWKTAKFSNKLVKENFVLAIIYNMIAIPLAVMGYVTPMIAVIAMSGSSLLVIGNSFRLNLRKK